MRRRKMPRDAIAVKPSVAIYKCFFCFYLAIKHQRRLPVKILKKHILANPEGAAVKYNEAM